MQVMLKVKVDRWAKGQIHPAVSRSIWSKISWDKLQMETRANFTKLAMTKENTQIKDQATMD